MLLTSMASTRFSAKWAAARKCWMLSTSSKWMARPRSNASRLLRPLLTKVDTSFFDLTQVLYYGNVKRRFREVLVDHQCCEGGQQTFRFATCQLDVPLD